MFNNLYETHIEVSDIERSINFYKNLGLEFAKQFDRCAFFWIGDKSREQMLGLWPVKERPVSTSHFAFGVDLEFLENSISWLEEHGMKASKSFGRDPIEPIVHSWVPAASVYFLDPDGNELEFLALLDGEPMQLDFTPYLSEWRALSQK
jgi:lactoylglutathione lyase